MSSELQPEQLLDLAQRSGAELAEVYWTSSESRPVYFEANELKQLESTQSEGVALRLWRQGKPGLAVAYGAVDPQQLVDRACALSDLNDPEEPLLADPWQAQFHDSRSPVAVEALMTAGRSAIAHIRDRYPAVLCSGEWTCSQEAVRLIDSRGLNLQQQDVSLSAYLQVEWTRGEDFLAVGEEALDQAVLDPNALTTSILQRLQWAEQSVPAPQGQRPVVIAARATDLLWGTVQAALNGQRVQEGSSPWSERLGNRILSPAVTLSQRPDFGPYACPFDDAGDRTQTFTLIEAGVLKGFYRDRRCGSHPSETTGNGFRPGLGSYPQPALVNCCLEPGTASLAALIAAIDDGILLDQTLGGGPDLAGDFSVNVDLGYRIQNGHITGRVKDTMLAGNVYTALQDCQLANDLSWQGNCWTPAIAVPALSLVSAT